MRSAIKLLGVLTLIACGDDDGPSDPELDGGAPDSGFDANRVWIDESFWAPPPPDCSPLASAYKFYMDGGRVLARDVYTVFDDGTVELARDNLGTVIHACSGSLAACGTLALDITDFRRAFDYASEEWWGDGSNVIGVGEDPRHYDGQVLVVERLTDGKKLVLGNDCENNSCIAAPGQYRQLFDGLRTEIAFGPNGDAGDVSSCDEALSPSDEHRVLHP
jgi:hypothetical protein